MTVTFTTTENQKNNINNNMTSIDLGECEVLLRNFYNISNNATLYMKKMDIKIVILNVLIIFLKKKINLFVPRIYLVQKNILYCLKIK